MNTQITKIATKFAEILAKNPDYMKGNCNNWADSIAKDSIYIAEKLINASYKK